MLTRSDASSIDNCLTELPVLLSKRGLLLKQKRGYKAGKLSGSRNWFHIVDGDMHPAICTQNAYGESKTWKLFARFDATQAPRWPWDKPRQRENKNPQGMILGDDVWGVSYEDLRDLSRTATSREVTERLTADLETSFGYSRQHYC